MHKDIYPALKILFDISTRIQKEMVESQSGISVLSYLKEFCTIRIMTSRRGGHDYGLARFLNESESKVIVISPNLAISRNFSETFIKVNGTIPSSILHFTLAHIKRENAWMRGAGHEIDIVAINPSFMLSKSLEDKLYKLIANRIWIYRDTFKPFYIIFVG